MLLITTAQIARPFQACFYVVNLITKQQVEDSDEFRLSEVGAPSHFKIKAVKGAGLSKGLGE